MNRQPHVCLFPGQLRLGGVTRVILNLAEGMLDKGARVDLFLSKRTGVHVSQIPDRARVFESRGTGSVGTSLPSLIRYLRRERPQLLIAARGYINIAAIIAKHLARVDTKVVVTEHTNHAVEKTRESGLRYPLLRIASRYLYPKADHIIAISEAVEDDMVRTLGLDPASIEIIHNASISDRIHDFAAEDVRDQWMDSATSPIVISVGRLEYQKDFHTLLRAFAQVRSRLDARLVILGEGQDRGSLESLARELNLASHVHLPGYAANPFAYIARSSVFVLSSRWEGLPTVLIESLAVGTPVVATDSPGGSREILVDGEYGKLVPVGDVDALAEAIVCTLNEPPPAERLKKRAMDFSTTKATERYLALI